ncbi:nuclear transport factor 2 family protein [Dactylosporangium sp. NPDC051484]|uniref:nuclear transport factor 2 family protein n=1 Tax=Dactylosporangium sp. NPDC051484 TaxID=3154942 RepID=UPI0034501D39
MVSSRLDIFDVVIELALRTDVQDAQGCAELFTEGATLTTSVRGTVVDGPVVGRSRLLERFEARKTLRGEARLRHVLSNFILRDHTLDSATVLSYMTLIVTTDDGSQVHSTAMNRDMLVLEDGRWLIQSRNIDFDAASSPVLPVAQRPSNSSPLIDEAERALNNG